MTDMGRLGYDVWDDEDDWDEGWDDEDDPFDPMRFDPWRGYLVVPAEYADDDAPEGDGGYLIPWSEYEHEMTLRWRYCPVCGRVDIAFTDGTFTADGCEGCNPIPF